MEIYRNKKGNYLVRLENDDSLMLLKKGDSDDYHVQYLDYFAKYKNIVPVDSLKEISKVMKVVKMWEMSSEQK